MNINRPKPAKGLTMGTFFGAFGSPIRTSYMDQAAPNNRDQHNLSPARKPRARSASDEVSGNDLTNPDELKNNTVATGDDDDADIADDVATIRLDRTQAAPSPMERRDDYPPEHAAPKVPQIQLDVAKKAKIPLFLKSPFYAAAQPAPPAAVAAPAPAPALAAVPVRANAQPVPVGRATLSRHINFTDVKLGRVIGEGAFGKVHEGKWRDRPVAVKLLICQDLRADILEEFQSEVEIMSVLRHPNICRLLGACMDPPNRCLVVELLPRGSLWGVLRTSRSIDEARRIGFINDTAKGMSYLHNFQPPILHRDLKSPNLLVDCHYAIKISDFGLSRVKAHVQTMTGNCGTVQWMAPEVLGNQKYTEKADVFSFGIVIWECVTGECPYDGMTQIQAALGVLNRNLRPVVPKTCPPFLAQLMKACWARQPELRPSFLQIVSALRDYSIRKSMGEQPHQHK
ncbi:TKL protein kinase [Aphanomyces invadans]|uniref:non-specific serine/threonine protein kinase n=1 Tax=Aphanomyces invadans TaxID=157072 RepID=A0A024TW65_9STRA|nr:TKL protein kinase [Aphanomyces invadans]ETV98268.1 TKL protein kinase [Aphanomyces invadans]|eukprot:XP_008873143.1 TKL protein kinase [Aphanomyces invadans]